MRETIEYTPLFPLLSLAIPIHQLFKRDTKRCKLMMILCENAPERGTEGETQFFAIKLVVEMMMAGRLLLFCRLLKGPAEKWSSRNVNEPHSIQLTVRFLAPKLAQFANATPRVFRSFTAGNAHPPRPVYHHDHHHLHAQYGNVNARSFTFTLL